MSEAGLYADLVPKSDIMEEAEEEANGADAMEDVEGEDGSPEEPAPAPLSFLE